MDERKEVLALIGARGGSTGIKRKNIFPLFGEPLIYYTIVAAKDSKYITRIVVSTDDEEIAKIARDLGAETPFIRPKKFATSTASAESFLKHALGWLEEHEKYKPDIVVYLQLTDLRRKRGIIDKCVEKLVANDLLDSVFVATPTHKKFWKVKNGKYVRITPKRYEPRQKTKKILFREDSGIACATRPRLIKKGIRIGDNVDIVIDEGPDIDIHTYDDLSIASCFIKNEFEKREKSKYYF